MAEQGSAGKGKCLHTVQWLNAKEFEARHECATGAGAKEQAAGPGGGVVYHDFIGIVKATIGSGQFVKVSA